MELLEGYTESRTIVEKIATNLPTEIITRYEAGDGLNVATCLQENTELGSEEAGGMIHGL